jgi:hypothetical protein
MAGRTVGRIPNREDMSAPDSKDLEEIPQGIYMWNISGAGSCYGTSTAESAAKYAKEQGWDKYIVFYKFPGDDTIYFIWTNSAILLASAGCFLPRV